MRAKDALRLVVVAAALALGAGLVACGGDGDGDETADTEPVATVPPPATTPTEPEPTEPNGVGPTGPTVEATARDGFVARLVTPRPDPRIGEQWGIEVTARTPGGDPLPARVEYVFLFGGQEVARPNVFEIDGRMRDGLTFPAPAAGRPLTFRVEVTAQGSTLQLDREVTVREAQ